MKVDKLYVICMREVDRGRNFDGSRYAEPGHEELLDEAKALAKRSMILDKVKQVTILDYSAYDNTRRRRHLPEQISPARTYGERGAAGHGSKVGVYVIVHRDGIVCRDLEFILEKNGITKIDKLNLVSCEAASQNFHLHQKICNYLGVKGYGNGLDGSIMVAAYVDYVTIAFPGRDSEIDLGKRTARNEKWEDFKLKGSNTAAHLEKLRHMKSGRKYVASAAPSGKIIKRPAYLVRSKNPELKGIKEFFAWSRSQGLHPIKKDEWTGGFRMKSTVPDLHRPAPATIYNPPRLSPEQPPQQFEWFHEEVDPLTGRPVSPRYD